MKQSSGMGVAIGLVLWGLCFLGLPLFMSITTSMPAAVAWICYVLGFLVLLIGIMGVCMEIGNRYSGGRNKDGQIP